MSLLKFISILRPSQWLKNLMLFFPPFLGGHLFQSGIASVGIVPFVAFCLVSSAGYVLNDILDRDRDRCHPKKQMRPIPSGKISPFRAGLLSGLLLCCGMAMAILISKPFLLILLSYVAVSMGYSFWLKNLPVIDLFCISAGFLLRLQAGGEVFHVVVSPWLFLCVLLLSLFLSTGKRLGEFRALGEYASAHRGTLALYPQGFLDGTMYMTGGALIVTYAMYSISKQKLIYTVPLCFFGLLRYIFRVRSGEGGDPTESLLKDHVLFFIGLLWMLMVAWSIYL